MDLKKQGELTYIGPPLEEGPLPTLIYFSLSAHESLTLDPFNQPIAYLANESMRLVSLTIPGHEEGRDKTKAIAYWAEELSAGRDPLTPFFDTTAKAIESLLPSCSSIALAGLSRGAFIACHIATRLPIETILGFAPLTRLSFAKEFDLEHLDLTEKTIRFYIGNRDLRVGTDNAFSLITSLANRAYDKRIRTSPFELIITPSIGFQGHGTSKEIFHAGAEWVKGRLFC